MVLRQAVCDRRRSKIAPKAPGLPFFVTALLMLGGLVVASRKSIANLLRVPVAKRAGLRGSELMQFSVPLLLKPRISADTAACP
ncbi:hypothetical protein ATY79_11045 [Rhizobium sp. R693]|nr:hypothetical protein ATY79_11045 [Rhizobium sp. R693]